MIYMYMLFYIPYPLGWGIFIEIPRVPPGWGIFFSPGYGISNKNVTFL